jgi:hypothetical protein
LEGGIFHFPERPDLLRVHPAYILADSGTKRPPPLIPNVVVKGLTLVLRIREILGSNLGPETDYPEVFRDVPQSLQKNAGIVP